MSHGAQYGIQHVTVHQLAIIMESNPFSITFANARQMLEAQPQTAVDIVLSTVAPCTRDIRRYNRPRASEVGMIVPHGALPGNIYHRGIIFQTHDSALHQISELHSAYLPLRFPLILNGTHRWTLSLPTGVLHAWGQGLQGINGELCYTVQNIADGRCHS